MKPFFFSLTLLCLAQTGLAEHIILDNETKHKTLVIQWVGNREEMQTENKAIVYGVTLNEKSLQTLHQTGKINVDIPPNAGYFRVLVWSTIDKKKPYLLTNWVDIVQGKQYSLHQDQLVPAALISGSGC